MPLKLFLLACGLGVATACFGESASVGLQTRLAGPGPAAIIAESDTIHARISVTRFFERRNFEPVWSRLDNAVLLDDLLAAIEAASTHGLRPADYHPTTIRLARSQDDREALELLATDAYLTLAAHILGGRIDPVSVAPDWTASGRERDLVRYLEDAMAARRVGESLEALEPDAPGYQLLKDALSMYRSAAVGGEWAPIDAGPALKLGAAGPRVAALRERLRGAGLIAASDSASAEFDGELEAAVVAFQRRMGLDPDGIVGPVTLRELNKGPADRVDQIRANLERWRWLPEALGTRHIRVNIADFRLEAYEAGRVVRRHDVIVGRSYRETPVFSDRISYIVLNPWWETPASIAREDKLPVFRKDPASISQQGFQLLDSAGNRVDPMTIDWSRLSADYFPYRVRQAPGPKNALGRVKIMFPNKHNVYLHDTPARQLFNRTERAFSSGCVRVADPIDLTEWLLAETDAWTRERIDAVIASGVETRVDLARKVPVHILYFTAVTESDGTLRLVGDVYARDARLIQALNSPPPAATEVLH